LIAAPDYATRGIDESYNIQRVWVQVLFLLAGRNQAQNKINSISARKKCCTLFGIQFVVRPNKEHEA